MADRPPFDAFLSYRQRSPDMEWVRGPLCDALRGAGVRVFLDVEQFRLGEPLVSEMARGVEQSAYTLVVATPAYLASTFTEFESLLSQHLGLEGTQHRLIVLMRETCELPLRLRYKLWLPMSTEKEIAVNLPRLLFTFTQPPRP